VDAGCAERPAAGAEGDLALLEVAEEVLPLGVGGGPVLLLGAGGAPAGDEGSVPVDDLLGVDRLVSHGCVDVGVSDDQLGDVRRHPVEHGVGDEEPSKVVGDETQWLAVGSGQAGGAHCPVQ